MTDHRSNVESPLDPTAEHLPNLIPKNRRAVLAALPIAYWSLDRKGAFVFAEGGVLSLLGIEAASLVGCCVFDLERQVPQFTAASRRALAGETFSSRVALGDRTIEIRYSPVRGELEQVIGAVGLATDGPERGYPEASSVTRHGLQQVVARVSARVAGAGPKRLDEGIYDGLRDIGEVFAVDQAAIFLLGNEGRELVEDCAWRAPETDLQSGFPELLNIRELPWLARNIEAGKAFQVAQVSTLPAEAGAEKALLLASGVSAFTAVPMFVEDTLIGLIALCVVRRDAPWTADHLDLLKLPAEIFATAFQRKQIELAMRNLVFGTAKVSGEALFEAVASYVASALGAHSVLIAERVGTQARALAFWVDGEMTEPFDYTWTNGSCGELNGQQDASFQECALGLALEHDEPIDGSQQRCLTVPLGDGTGRVIGHICVHRPSACMAPGTRVILQAFAERAAAELKRQQAEADLRMQTAALEATASAIVITESEGSIRWANPAFSRLTGYSSAELLGRNISILNSGRQPPEFYDEMWTTIRSGRAWRGELVNRRKDGNLYPEGMTITPVRNRAGEIVNFIALKRDISDIKEAAQQQEQLQRKLQQTNKLQALGLMVGGIAHDFNNILASVMGYADLARLRFGRQQGGKLGEYLDEIYRGGERARDLVSQMLIFSRGGQSDARALMLEPLAKEVVRMLQSTLPSSIGVTVQAQAGLPAVMIDPVQFNQVLVNLCLNARDAIAGNGEITVRVRLVEVGKQYCASCRDPLRGQYVELSVADSGSGIDQDAWDQMFDPFFTTKDIGKGTGMGLSVVHGIVHGCGGHLGVETASGRGSVFRVLLPPVVPQVREPASAKEKLPGEHRLIEGHVLVVDDEPSVVRYLAEVLGGAGCRVTATVDSQEALARFQEDPFGYDLLVTDQTMPKMTGDQLISILAKIRPDLPVVLCTGHSEKIDEDEAQARGIAAFLMKPVETRVLLDTVERLLA